MKEELKPDFFLKAMIGDGASKNAELFDAYDAYTEEHSERSKGASGVYARILEGEKQAVGMVFDQLYDSPHPKEMVMRVFEKKTKEFIDVTDRNKP